MSIIQEVVTKIPDWKKKKVSITPLSGGLTNSNIKVEVDGVPYFIRIPGAGAELLAIHRENEHYNRKALLIPGGLDTCTAPRSPAPCRRHRRAASPSGRDGRMHDLLSKSGASVRAPAMARPTRPPNSS